MCAPVSSGFALLCFIPHRGSLVILDFRLSLRSGGINGITFISLRVLMIQEMLENNNNHAYLLNLKRKILLGIIDVLIIAWLKEKPLSGQEIMARIKAEYGISLSAGTLYPILSSLQNKGLITSLQDEKRKLYQLTPKGRVIGEKLSARYKQIESDLKENFNNNFPPQKLPRREKSQAQETGETF